MSINASVYVISCDDLDAVKIGVSSAPERRLAQLRVGNPYRLSMHGSILIGSAEDAAKVEAASHLVMTESRASGEWFFVSARIAMAVVSRLAAVLGNESMNFDEETEKAQVSYIESGLAA